MNPNHLHLLVNHLPVLGTIFGLCAPSSGLAAGVAYLTGEGAEEVAESVGVAEEVISRHEDAAFYALIAAIVLGVLALFGPFFFRERLPRPLRVTVVILALAVSGIMAWTANLGGQIRRLNYNPPKSGSSPNRRPELRHSKRLRTMMTTERKVRLVLLVTVLMASACRNEPAEPRAPTVPDDVAPRAAAVLKPFKEGLKAALLAGMEEGLEHAMSVCRMQAPVLAAAAGGAGVRVGRTSHKLRNPANAPEPWMRPWLDAYLDDAAERMPHAVRLDAETAGYVEPIYMVPICLTCHGEAIADTLQAQIDESYLYDRAVGFRDGQFRGLFWVTLPVQAPEPPAVP